MTLLQYTLPEIRRGALKPLLGSGRGIRVIEAHSGLSALVGSRARLVDKGVEFDALWISSLTCSAARGLPDAEMYLIERRLDLVQEVCASSNKPLIVDGDTGGDGTNFKYLVTRLEALGVSAVVIEDKRHPKRNSLSDGEQHLEDPDVFSAKLRDGKKAARSGDFLVFARLESLIAGRPLEDALERAVAYVAAGADGIMIHSKSSTPQFVFEFIERFRSHRSYASNPVPLICVPTTYNSVTAQELFRRGVQIVVHANHLLRASHHAMIRACETILQHDRSMELDNLCSPVISLMEEVGYSDVLADDLERAGGGYLSGALRRVPL